MEIKVYSNLVDDEISSFRMFYPGFRLNNFVMRALVLGTSTEYSIEFQLPSRELRVSCSDGFALYPFSYYYDLRDNDETWTIYGNLVAAFEDYNLDKVYELAKTLTEKIVLDEETKIENAE